MAFAGFSELPASVAAPNNLSSVFLNRRNSRNVNGGNTKVDTRPLAGVPPVVSAGETEETAATKRAFGHASAKAANFFCQSWMYWTSSKKRKSSLS